MNKVLQTAYDYLIGGGDIDFYSVLDHLNSIGIYPSEAEVDEIYNMISDVLLELDLIRSLKLKYDMRKINRLVYGI